MARLYLDVGQPEQALVASRATSESYPELAGPHVSAGHALLQLGRTKEAVAELEAALRISPFDPRPHCGLAEAFRATADARVAREETACRSLE